jgi:hypothetical protein
MPTAPTVLWKRRLRRTSLARHRGRSKGPNASSTEMLRLSISRLLFLAIADAPPTPPGTPPWPRRGLSTTPPFCAFPPAAQ